MAQLRPWMTWIVASLLYLLALYIPGYGITLAPILVAIVVAEGNLPPSTSAGLAFLSALTGYALALALTSGIEGLSMLAGLGGGLIFILTILYHLMTPTLLSYVMCSYTCKK